MNESTSHPSPLPERADSAVELAQKLRGHMIANQYARRCRYDELHRDGSTIEAAAEMRIIAELDRYCEMLLRLEHDYRVLHAQNASIEAREKQS